MALSATIGSRGPGPPALTAPRPRPILSQPSRVISALLARVRAGKWGKIDMDTATLNEPHEVVTEDVEYRRIDGEPLLARLYRPRGPGPFPAVVGVHGGAWTSGDRLNNAVIDQALAAAGVLVMALDFRIAPRSPYPASVIDVNFGIRWLKAKATTLGARPDWVGAVGGSSGGHQTLLAIMRPHDPRYEAAPELGAADGAVDYAVACWPICDPLARYRMAQARGNERLVQAHNDFFRNEEAMQEGNPQLLLERGEKVEPALAPRAAGDQGRQRHARHGVEIHRRLAQCRRRGRARDVRRSAAHLRDQGARFRRARGARSP